MSTQSTIEAGAPGTYTDSKIQRDVLDELASEPSVEAARIGVAVKDGIVTLTGHVRSYAEKFAAERAARRVRGVRAIANEIEIELPGRSRRSDEEIAEEVVRALRSHLVVTDLKITPTVQDGWVTLEGEVEWQYPKEAAEDAIRHVPAVRGVTNNLKVKPRVAPTEVKARIEEALRRNAAVDAGRITIEVEGGKVTLRGSVPSLHQKEKIERLAWSAPGVYYVEDLLTVEP